MTAQKQTAPAAAKAWRAATTRLPETLEMYDGFSDARKATFAMEWGRYKRLPQVTPRAEFRNRQVTMSKLSEIVYTHGMDTYDGPKIVSGALEAEHLGGVNNTMLVRAEFLKTILRQGSFFLLRGRQARHVPTPPASVVGAAW